MPAASLAVDGPSSPPRRRWLIALCFLPFVALLAWQIDKAWFLCDDAFIAFRYARNLGDGHGIVFNRGERVEGFVDFLWVLQLGGLWRLGVRPEIAAPALSLLSTAGTLVLVVAFARRLAGEGQRLLTTWIAFGLVAGSASFAVWSTSGLETRQFTFFVLLAIWLADRRDASRGRLLLASTVFALAELSRPEAMLLFGVTVAWTWFADRLQPAPRRSSLLWLCVPFVAVVAAHFLWRYAYYGEWLPNVYYTKHVRPWYEAGFAYLAAATIELGAFVWLPLGLVTAARHAVRRDLSPALPFVLIAAHAAYLLRIGGDHFEFRPLDFYLPLTAGAAAAGLHQLAAVVAAALRTTAAPSYLAATIAALAALPVLFYSHALGAISLATGISPLATPHDPVAGLQLDGRRSSLLRVVPGLMPLAAALNPLRAKLYPHSVAVPVHVHQNLERQLRAQFAAAEALPAGVFPPDAVAAAVSVGVLPYHLRELTFIDVHGLTDKTVAHTEVTVDDSRRRMAHDRIAKVAYLRQRGVNLDVEPVVQSRDAALAVADFALRIDDQSWLPLQVADRQWAQRAFPADRLAAAHHVDSQQAAANRLSLPAGDFVGRRLLATFEVGDAGRQWQCRGDVGVRPNRLRVFGSCGDHQLATEPGDEGADGVGSASSSQFTPAAGEQLVFFAAGERGRGLELRLCRGDEVLQSFRPVAHDRLLPQLWSLDAWIGQALHLELHDAGPGWLVLDHVLLVQRAGNDIAQPPQPAPTAPFADCVQVTPLPRAAGGEASAGRATLTVRNPLPVPLRLQVELDGPAGVLLLCGEWQVQGGEARRGSPQPVAELAAGASAKLPLFVEVPVGFEPRRQPAVLLLRATPMLLRELDRSTVFEFELPLLWQ